MKLLYFLLVTALLVGCAGEPENPIDPSSSIGMDQQADEALWQKASTLFAALPALAENPENELSAAKVALGKTLYYDVRLSKEGNISCNSCHNLETFGVDNLPFSPGDDGSLGGRNSPTVLNAALHVSQFWDGRAKDVEEQAGGPVLNPVEMAIPDEKFMVKRLQGIEEYQSLFKEAFPTEATPITYLNMQKAIGAFERTLLTPSRWDEYLNGDKTKLTEDEKMGLTLFIDNNCITCHTGVNLGGHMYQKFGLLNPYWEYTGSEKKDEGRKEVTGLESDLYMFKVPSLRNIAKTQPYFHDGSVSSLEDAVTIMAKTQLAKDLSEADAKSIVTFLEVLTGEVPAEALMATK